MPTTQAAPARPLADDLGIDRAFVTMLARLPLIAGAVLSIRIVTDWLAVPPELVAVQERSPAVDTDRLEGCAAPEQRLVVRAEDGSARIDQSPARDGYGEERHAGTRPPTAA